MKRVRRSPKKVHRRPRESIDETQSCSHVRKRLSQRRKRNRRKRRKLKRLTILDDAEVKKRMLSQSVTSLNLMKLMIQCPLRVQRALKRRKEREGPRLLDQDPIHPSSRRRLWMTACFKLIVKVVDWIRTPTQVMTLPSLKAGVPASNNHAATCT